MYAAECDLARCRLWSVPYIIPDRGIFWYRAFYYYTTLLHDYRTTTIRLYYAILLLYYYTITLVLLKFHLRRSPRNFLRCVLLLYYYFTTRSTLKITTAGGEGEGMRLSCPTPIFFPAQALSEELVAVRALSRRCEAVKRDSEQVV